MRRILVVAGTVLVTLLLAHPQLHAQGINVGLGPTLSMGDFFAGGGVGYHVVGGFRFGGLGLPVALRPEIMFQEIPGGTGIPNHRFYGITANAEAAFPLAMLSPYLIGGVGIFQHERPGITGDPHDDWGFNIGAGTRFGLGGLNAYAEARYHQFFGDVHTGAQPAFIPITVGLTF